MAVSARRACSRKPDDNPPTIRGRVLRTYSVGTLDDVDAYLVGLGKWAHLQMLSSMEFGWDHLVRYLHDVDLLLDARLRLMAARDLAAALTQEPE
jgi:hypothetical protein